MDRLIFTTLAYGQYAETHLQDTIEKDDMQKFVDGAVWAYDFLNKQQTKAKLSSPQPPDPFIYTQEESTSLC
jgi:hypothetical protein